MHWSPRLRLVPAALLALGVACGPADGPDEIPTASTVRDLLGLSAERIEAIPANERPALRDRIERMHDDAPALDPAAPAEARTSDDFFPVDPLASIIRLDEARRIRGLDARPFAVYGRDAAGAWAASCPPNDDEREALRTLRDIAPGWAVGDGWNDDSERDRVAELTGALSLWADRCTAQALDRLPELQDGDWVVQREEHAPALLAWWPQRRKLYVNPLLLALYHPQATRDLRTTHQAASLPSTSVEACVTAIGQFCSQCATDEAARNNPACTPLLPGSTAPADCLALQSGRFAANGLQAWCVHEIFSARATIRQCTVNRAASTGQVACNPGRQSVVSIETFAAAYPGYIDEPNAERCTDLVRVCIDPSLDPNRPDTGVEPEPDAGGGKKKKEGGAVCDGERCCEDLGGQWFKDCNEGRCCGAKSE